MNPKDTNPVENEYRSSQMYRSLKNSGIPVADVVARGLGVAAQTVDRALNSVAPAVRPVGNSAQGPKTYAYTVQGQPGQTPPRQTPPTGQQVPPRAPQPNRQQTYAGPPMKAVRRRGPARFYVTGALAIWYAMNFMLYTGPQFVRFLVFLAVVFGVCSLIFKGKTQFVPMEQPQPEQKPQPAPEKKQAAKPEPVKSTGNPEVDKLIADGQDYLKRLRAANAAIPDEALSEDIDRMERASADIFRYIADHPEKAPQIRKFMSYYLPTTLKLLNSYQRLSAQSVKGENITSTMFNIAGMMHTVAIAFEKQLDSLFSDEAMDVSADISVFETLLKQEGFVEGNDPKTSDKS